MEYNIKYKNIFEFIELKNIIASRRRLLKDKNARMFNYFNEFYLLIIACVLFFIIGLFITNEFLDLIFFILLILSLGLVLSFLVLFLIFVIQYSYLNKGRKGKLLFNDNGLVDFSDKGYIFGFSWDKINLVVVGRKSTVVFSKYPVCIFINSKDNRDLLNNIKLYNKNINIIYRKK